MISVAAELADMHPQTLRMYEARGLIEPKRSPKGTRLYSHEDVERLRRIQEMTAELGMNLAGVERVFELEEQLEPMARKVAALEKRAAELKAEVRAARGAAPRAASRDRALREGRRARAHRRPQALQDPRAARPARRGSCADAVTSVGGGDGRHEPCEVVQRSGLLVRTCGALRRRCLLAFGARSRSPAARWRGRRESGPVPPQQQLQLVLPLSADLRRPGELRARGVDAGLAAVRRTTSRSRRWPAGSGPSGDALAGRGLPARGRRHRRQDRRHRPVRRRDDDRCARRSGCSGRRCAVFRTARRGRFVAPTAAARVPAALRGLVTAVVGLDTRSLTGSSTPHAAPGAARRGRRASAHAAGQPTSAAPLTGTPSGCGGALAVGGFTPEPVPDRLRLRAAARAGSAAQGERVALIEIDGFRTRDIDDVRELLRPGRASPGGVRRRAQAPLPPGGEATLDLEVLDAAAPGLKAIDVYETKPSARPTRCVR